MDCKKIIFIIVLFLLVYPVVARAGCCYDSTWKICWNIPDNAILDQMPVESRCDPPRRTFYLATWCDSTEGNEKCVNAKGEAVSPQSNCASRFCLQVPFPGSDKIEKAVDKPEFLAIAIVAIFQFGVWIAISFSIFMIMIAGFIWLTSAGNQSSIGRAKGYITNAIVGLLIALFSYVILETINPQLVALRMPGLPQIPKTNSDCCWRKSDVKIALVTLDKKTCQEMFGGFYGGTWEQCPQSFMDIQNCCIGSEYDEKGVLIRNSYYKNIKDLQQCKSEENLTNPPGHSIKAVWYGSLMDCYMGAGPDNFLSFTSAQ